MSLCESGAARRRADRQTGRQRVRERWGSCPGKAPTTYSFLLVIPGGGGGGVVESCLANMLSILLLLLLLMLLIFLTSSVNHNEINTTWAVKVGVMPCPTLPCPALSCLATPLSFQSSPAQPASPPPPLNERLALLTTVSARDTKIMYTVASQPATRNKTGSAAGVVTVSFCRRRPRTCTLSHLHTAAATLHCHSCNTTLPHHHHTAGLLGARASPPHSGCCFTATRCNRTTELPYTYISIK